MKLIQQIGTLVIMAALMFAVGTGCRKKSEEKNDSHEKEQGHAENDGHDHSKH